MKLSLTVMMLCKPGQILDEPPPLPSNQNWDPQNFLVFNKPLKSAQSKSFLSSSRPHLPFPFSVCNKTAHSHPLSLFHHLPALYSTSQAQLSLPPLSLKAYQVSFQRLLQFQLHAVSCQKHTCSNAHTHAHTRSKKSNGKSWLQVAVKRCMPPSGSLREQRSWYSCNMLTVSFKQAPNVWFPVLCLQPISNADFIVPVEIDGTVHQVPCKWAQM